jgi:hypothetical protein
MDRGYTVAGEPLERTGIRALDVANRDPCLAKVSHIPHSIYAAAASRGRGSIHF